MNRANLSGANLSSANLSRADLRRVDFSEVDLKTPNVTKTRFGYNKGISQIMRQDLEERGAIFEDSPNKPTYASQRR